MTRIFLGMAAGLLAAAGLATGAPEPDVDALERSVSANRSLAARYRSEYEALLSGAGDGALDEGLRKDLDRLWSKILLVEKEARRTLDLIARDAADEGGGRDADRTGPAGSPAMPDAAALEDALRPDGEVRPLLGKDWLRMSDFEKERYVFSAVRILSENGVFVTRPYYFYVEELDAVVGGDRFFEEEYLDNLFITSAEDHEPETRVPIERLKHRALKRLGLPDA